MMPRPNWIWLAMTEPQKPTDPLPLSALHQRTVAVELSVMGIERRLIGRGLYEQDAELGPVLRIVFPSAADGEIVLEEGTWKGEILSGKAAGCDYRLRLE